MGQIVVSVLPPEYWEDFEQLTLDVFKIVWEDNNAQKHGRSGQDQSGVDVFGRDVRLENKWVGVQCKKRRLIGPDGRLLAGGSLTKDDIAEEIKKAFSFRPVLAHFIVATTALRDAETQRTIRQLDDKQRKQGEFSVSTWFWEDFQEQLNLHSQLMYRYYEDVLKSRGAYDPDKHILYLLHTAFSRPAFDTPFHLENNVEDFLQAIKATQEAIKTGRLKDNLGHIIESAHRANKLSNPRWRADIEKISEILQEIREVYTAALAKGDIQQHRLEFIEFRGRGVADILNALRCNAISNLNHILGQAGLDKVKSRLLTMTD